MIYIGRGTVLKDSLRVVALTLRLAGTPVVGVYGFRQRGIDGPWRDFLCLSGQ